MVLLRHLNALWLLAAAAACNKGPGPSDTTPPGPTTSSVGQEEDGTSGAPDDDVTDDGSAEPPLAEDTEELYVDGVRLWLAPVDCRLTAKFLDEQRTHRFEFPGECHFSGDKAGQPRIIPTDHGKAMIVESSVPAEGNDCDTALQVVVVTENGPELSRQIQRVSFCAPAQWDETMYHVLASERVAFSGT